METKWYKTKKFYFAVVAVVAFALSLVGINLDEATQQSIIDGLGGVFGN